MSDPKHVEDFYSEKGVVPFRFARNPSNLLLQAATISSAKAEFGFLNAGFDENYFKSIKCDTQDLDSLLLEPQTDTVPDVNDVFSANEKHSAKVDANAKVPALPGAKAGGEIKRAQEESSRLLFTDLKTVSLQQYHGLIPFFEKHLYLFCFNNPVLSLECDTTPSIFSGHQIDLVVAFVVRYLEGKQYEKSSSSSEQTTRIEGGGQIAGVEGNLDSEQGFNKELKRKGALGVTYLLMHVVSEVGTTDIDIKDGMFVPSPGGGKGRLRTFFRNARFKNLRKIVGGCSPSQAYLMESEPTKNHPTLEAHGGAVLKSGAATSLGCGGWEEGEGFMDTVVELREENRLGEDDPIVDGLFTSSRHLIIRGSVTRLSEMYSKFKQGEKVTVAGSKVLSLSPAFLVDTSELLPIHYLKIVGEDVSKVPGRVVREFKGATILYPVHGYEGNKNWVSVDDDDDDPWEVRESIVRIPRSETVQRDNLLEKGFFQLDETEDTCYKEGKIAMARHQLARKSDPRENGQSPFRPVPVASYSKASASTAASMPSLTSSHGSPTHGKKRKEM